MVAQSQGVGHHADQLVEGSVGTGGELLPKVGRQDDEEDVSQELEEKRPEQVRGAPWNTPPFALP